MAIMIVPREPAAWNEHAISQSMKDRIQLKGEQEITLYPRSTPYS